MMGVIEFGEQLLQTGDLDPIYIMLHESGFSQPKKQRFCIAYWLYYHAGVSASASEKPDGDFWEYLDSGLDGFPRGTERRHFRGRKAKVALDALSARYPYPEDFTAYLGTGFCDGFPPLGMIARGSPGGKGGSGYLDQSYPSAVPFAEVSKRTQEHLQFGPWIAFKVADMMERVLSVPVDFSGCDVLDMYREPGLGAQLAAEQFGVQTPRLALAFLQKHFANHTAPPSHDRKVNIAEIETVLCKWKAHMNGHYPVGKDTREVTHALHGWGGSAAYLGRIMQRKCTVRSLV